MVYIYTYFINLILQIAMNWVFYREIRMDTTKTARYTQNATGVVALESCYSTESSELTRATVIPQITLIWLVKKYLAGYDTVFLDN